MTVLYNLSGYKESHVRARRVDTDRREVLKPSELRDTYRSDDRLLFLPDCGDPAWYHWDPAERHCSTRTGCASIRLCLDPPSMMVTEGRGIEEERPEQKWGGRVWTRSKHFRHDSSTMVRVDTSDFISRLPSYIIHSKHIKHNHQRKHHEEVKKRLYMTDI